MTTRKGLNHLGQSGATDGQVPVWNAESKEWEPGTAGGITGLTSADATVTVTDNGDGTLDLSAPGGGGGARWEVLMASDGSGSPLVASNGDWLYGEAT